MSLDASVDVHLLRCLAALVELRHVSRAAERVGITQPTMSYNLQKLRRLLADEILVRTPRGVVATERAQEIAAAVAGALVQIDTAIESTARFEPATSHRRFTLAASDYVGLALMPRLMRQLEREAPGVALVIQPSDPRQTRDHLEGGEVDLAIGFWTALSGHLRARELFQEPVLCLARRHHPRVKDGITLAQYLAEGHVQFCVLPGVQSSLEALVDSALEAGRRRRVALETTSLLTIPHIVAGSELLAVLPWRAAQHFGRLLDCQVLPFPVDIGRFSISMAWHERMQRDPGHLWLRRQVQAACEEAA